MTKWTELLLNAPEMGQFYSKYFSYFNMLDAAEKDRFLIRCIQFISEKEIHGAENFQMNNQVKAIVAASAVQLTLGLEVWNLSYFRKIIIHPSDFFNAQMGLQFSGETNTGGFVKLSWKKFIEGYKVQDDNLNLALHEFAHALHLNSSVFTGGDYFIKYYFHAWKAAAREAFEDLQNDRESIFRRYGKVNITEFLSVCIEHFFESPDEIREKYFQLYCATAILLNQEIHNGKVRINIRNEYFLRKLETLQGFDHFVFTTDLRQSRSVGVALVMAIIIFIAWSMRLSTIPLLVSLIIFLLSAYLYYDYRFRIIDINGREFTIQKGKLIYKKRESLQLLVSHLMLLNLRNDKISMLYYNVHTTFFHLEKLKLTQGDLSTLKIQLRRNIVAAE